MVRKRLRRIMGPATGAVDGAAAIVVPDTLGAVSAVTGMVTGALNGATAGEPTPPDSPRYDKRAPRRRRREARRANL